MRLVLLATSGNQSYIFASNRLREAVGASYLVACSTTDWLDEACQDVNGVKLQVSSGNALVTVPDQGSARKLVAAVTLRALKQAPGLSVTGVSIEIAAELPTANEITAVFEEWQKHSARTVGSSARFQRLPVVAGCASTDGPAAHWHSDLGKRSTYPEDEEPLPLSAEVIAKRDVRKAAERRMNRLAGTDRLMPIRDFFSSVEWAAVVHADGNRLGQLFREAPDLLAQGGSEALGQLSEEVRELAESALRQAVAEVTDGHTPLPLVPLVVGGDDLTVLIDGKLALKFTVAYLRAFGRQTAKESTLRRAGRTNLTACAGVALVKPHYPFSEAYRLAEELCKNAKQHVSDGHHGLDVHVLLDARAGSLPKIRDALRDVNQDSLTDRPYLLAAAEGVAVPTHRDWDKVESRIKTIASKHLEGAAVTPAQLHHLREELRSDPELARRRLAALRERAIPEETERLAALCPDGERITGLYDLLELAPFVGGDR